ncbi:response regulator transcription factor [Adlercreutzia shanghongiae]|uniref:LuxR C-terminal-related transcriptional regulator n=1 Tax=Adlercreutzia shanghongiae TaxID=3111773 RepID=A0ABU6IVP3_9ACTN|nr:LuxR C-terminal-related transcriptional regulator [Adlercreutzia sp. R22]MEC4293897.1 LuxR C-terminal-related transcriptional regulator [Adlercreutzia sp. R22]
MLIFELSLASIIMIICYFLLIALPTFAAPWIALSLPLTAGMIALSPTNPEERETSPKAAAKQTPNIPLFVASILLSGGISKTLLTNNWVAADSFGWLWATIPLGIALCLLSVFASAKNAPIVTYSFLSSFVSFVVLCTLFLPSQHFSLAGLMFASAWFLLVYTIASSIWLGGLHSANPSVFACAIIGWFFFLTEATAYFTKFFPMHDTSLLIIAVVLLMISLALMMIASNLQATRSDNNGTASSLKSPEETDIIEHCRAIAGQYGLTEREYDVLTLLAKGNSLKSIAEKLIVSENTVKSHRRHVYQKLGINSRQSLIDMIERN